MSMDFVFGLTPHSNGRTGIMLSVYQYRKMAHLEAVPDSIDAAGSAQLCLDRVFR